MVPILENMHAFHSDSSPNGIAKSPLNKNGRGTQFNDLSSLTKDELEILAIQARKRQILNYENAMLAKSHLVEDFQEFEKKGSDHRDVVPKSTKPSKLFFNNSTFISPPSQLQTSPLKIDSLTHDETKTAYQTPTPTTTFPTPPSTLSKSHGKESLTSSSSPSSSMTHLKSDPPFTPHHAETNPERKASTNFLSSETITFGERSSFTSDLHSTSNSPSPLTLNSNPIPLSENQSLDAFQEFIEKEDDGIQLPPSRSEPCWRDIEEPSFLHQSHTSFHLDFLSNSPLENDDDLYDHDSSNPSSTSIPPSKWMASHFPILARPSTTTTTTTSSSSSSMTHPKEPFLKSIPPPTSLDSSHPSHASIPPSRSLPTASFSLNSPTTQPSLQKSSSVPGSIPSISSPSFVHLPSNEPSTSTSTSTSTSNSNLPSSSTKNISTEFTQLQKERHHFEKAKLEFDKEKLRFKQTKESFEQWRQEEWTHLEEEKRKLKRDRMLFEKHKKINDLLPTKRERLELEALKTQLQELQDLIKQKELKSKLSEERYKQRLDQLAVSNKELKEELLFLQSTPNLATTSPSSLLSVKDKEKEQEKEKEKKKPVSRSLPHFSTPSRDPDPPVAHKPHHHSTLTTSPKPWTSMFEKIEKKRGLGTPLEERNIKDGLVERRYEQGVRVVVFKNGTSKEYLKEKEVTHYLNDDQRETYPDGKIVYFFKRGQIKTTTYPDGTIVNEFPDGQYERKSVDGFLHVQFPNGTKRVVYPNGNKEDYY
ncbi:hypothetical protein HMI56_000033, partial [Coelomomyces lativittatus]